MRVVSLVEENVRRGMRRLRKADFCIVLNCWFQGGDSGKLVAGGRTREMFGKA